MPDHAPLAKESSDLLGYRVPTPFGVDDPMTSSLWGDPVQSLATMLNSGEAKWHRHFISPADDLSLAVAATGAESPVVAAPSFPPGPGLPPPPPLTSAPT